MILPEHSFDGRELSHSPDVVAIGVFEEKEEIRCRFITHGDPLRPAIFCDDRLDACISSPTELFLLVAVIAATSIFSIIMRVRPETSCTGIGITVAALLIMPLLGMVEASHCVRYEQSGPGSRCG